MSLKNLMKSLLDNISTVAGTLIQIYILLLKYLAKVMQFSDFVL